VSRWMYEAPSSSGKVEESNTVRGLIRDLKLRLGADFALDAEIRPISDDSDRVGHFVVIRRKS